MKSGAEKLLSVLAEAEKPGDELPPDNLLAIIGVQTDPIRALSDFEQNWDIFQAIRLHISFLDFVRATNKPPKEEDKKRLVGLIRWLIRGLRDWREANDTRYQKLAALFVVARSCDMDDTLWGAFPPGTETNLDLLGVLEKLVGRFNANFTVRYSGPMPFWENDAAERFKQADARGDWITLGKIWRQFEQAILPNIFLAEAVRCLYRFGFDHLIRALSGTKQIVIAMEIVSSLSTLQCLKIGFASENPYIQFGAIYKTVSGSSKNERLTCQEQEILANLLIKIAGDTPRWRQWMQVFNSYPLRYHAMQVSLGQALAIVPESAIPAYVDTIILSTTKTGSRQYVTECLRAFYTAAVPERRHLLWKLAHQRWSKWQFGSAEKNNYLFDIGFSELDYAVIGYILECMNEGERKRAESEIFGELNRIRNKWYASLSDYITEWNRLLSQLQPYAHVKNNNLLPDDWLMQNKQYLPFDPQQNRYLTIWNWFERSKPESSATREDIP